MFALFMERIRQKEYRRLLGLLMASKIVGVVVVLLAIKPDFEKVRRRGGSRHSNFARLGAPEPEKA